MRFWYTVLTAGGRKLHRCINAEPSEAAICAALAASREFKNREVRHLTIVIDGKPRDGFYETFGHMLRRPLNHAASQLVTDTLRLRDSSFAKSRGRLVVHGHFGYLDKKVLQDC